MLFYIWTFKPGFILIPVKGKKIDPKKITEKEKIRKIFVGGVALDTPEEEVRTHFEQVHILIQRRIKFSES